MTAWPAGVCHYCGITDADVDGDRIGWLTPARCVCNQFACRRKFENAKRELARDLRQATRKRTPAEIHELKTKERAAKRRRNRQAATDRGLLKPKGGRA